MTTAEGTRLMFATSVIQVVWNHFNVVQGDLDISEVVWTWKYSNRQQALSQKPR